MKLLIDIPEVLLDRIKSAKSVPDMYGSDIVNTAVCVRDGTPYEERPHGEWIEDIRSMICKVNDYYGYTDSMHMFKVLFDQKYHGWKREGESSDKTPDNR